jgi:hypothetical protein
MVTIAKLGCHVHLDLVLNGELMFQGVRGAYKWFTLGIPSNGSHIETGIDE